MTRYTIPANDPHHKVAVGWDPPLGSFFAYVADTRLDEEENPILWVGAGPPYVADVADLAKALQDHAVLSEQMRQQLAVDQLDSLTR